ncbi:uncharacterized protein METZ01_LOCUS404490 [marine metagenome]|uniref:DUF4345 domain-containing protein n=1 Tax=marine metagenome TaxID=408172 RepID=A0A382VYF8_9ZZZZ
MHYEKNNLLSVNQRIIQICLFLLAAISLFGGALQMYLGQPETSPRLDNIHRFMAGVYFSMGPLAIWAAISIRKHNHLIFFLAFSVLMAGIGRLISMSAVGLPSNIFLIYLIPELSLPFIMIGSQICLNRKLRNKNE